MGRYLTPPLLIALCLEGRHFWRERRRDYRVVVRGIVQKTIPQVNLL
ncbi:hypothetical protein BN903_26 [Halorubrum sp. AJ67]|nr:hypothetical protein BN903_26 [Halorubrum sp. AJ67]